MQFFRRGKRNDLEFLSDSAEQIARSIDMTGLRTEIDQAFEAAIARVGGIYKCRLDQLSMKLEKLMLSIIKTNYKEL